MLNINENDQGNLNVGERKVKIMKKGELEEADKSLEKANNFLDNEKAYLTLFLQMLD